MEVNPLTRKCTPSSLIPHKITFGDICGDPAIPHKITFGDICGDPGSGLHSPHVNSFEDVFDSHVHLFGEYLTPTYTYS